MHKSTVLAQDLEFREDERSRDRGIEINGEMQDSTKQLRA
jgi:hypothetical protein